VKNYLCAPFRRHLASGCTCNYDRSVESCIEPTPGSRTYKKDLAADCECPIVVGGYLRSEVNADGSQKRLRYISTGATDWKTANRVRDQWLEWGRITPPAGVIGLAKQNVTVKDAVERFLKYQGEAGKNLDKDTIRKFEVLLNQRLLPFCESRGIVAVKAFDDKPVCEDFFLSWKNLNPHENKKGLEWVDLPLADSTKTNELTGFRTFLRYCVESKWLIENQAKKLKVRKVRTARKHGLTIEEFKRVLDTIEIYPDCHGKLGQVNAQRLNAFVYAMRYGGLRISDATALHSSQLVRRTSGTGWSLHIIFYASSATEKGMEKTGSDVYIPIPDFVADTLHKLPFRCNRDGAQYWFWNGAGTLDTATKTWRRTLDNLFLLTQAGRPFRHSASSHVLRHTFAITALNEGTPIEWVSKWLGHASIKITQEHYGHANQDTMRRSEDAYDEMMAKVQERQRVAASKVVEIPRSA
jgi:integrase